MKQIFVTLLLIWAGLSACEIQADNPDVGEETAVHISASQGSGPGLGLGSNSGLSVRHHAPIPEEYASLTSPVVGNEESLARGAAVYAERCLICHGENGQGDGPASLALDPAPVNVAFTSRKMSDAYLFYRISEGGLSAPFNSVMPAWKDILDAQSRWDVINYIRTLDPGSVVPNQQSEHSEHAVYDPVAEAAEHADMVAAGVAQGLLTQADGDVFLAVHAELDGLLAAEAESGEVQVGDNRRATFLRWLVDEGKITQAESDVFTAVHDTLTAAGLME